jgi:putative oxidoreductase
LNPKRFEEVAWLALRLVAGLLFFQAGARKLFGWYGGMPAGNELAVLSQIWIGAVLEVAGGVLIMLGLFTRPVAFILAGEMAVAYWQFHAPKGTWPAQNGGVAAVLHCFIFLFMAARGAGPWSLDAKVRNRR